jgi:gingipain R
MVAQAQTQITVVYQDAETTILDIDTRDYILKPESLPIVQATDAMPTYLDGAVTAHLVGGTPLLAKGKPALDKLSTSVQIAPTGNISIEILEAQSTLDINLLVIAPSKGDLKRNVNPNKVPFEFGDTYLQNANYPGDLVRMSEPFIYKSTRGVHLWLQPLQYNPVTETLRFYHHFRVQLTRTDAPSKNENPQAARLLAGSETEREICRRLYINHADNTPHTQEKMPINLAPEKMLVLCPDAFVADLQPLIDWKRQMGIHTTLVRTSELAGTDTSSVQQFVRQKYLTEGIDYLLLVGDDAQFPSLMRKDGAYYSCDNCFGYLDGDDHMPEVMVGRLHAETPEQLRLMVQRNLEYEKAPVLDAASPWMHTQLWAASNEGANIGDDGQADWQHANDWKTQHKADGCGDFFEFYDADHGAESPTVGHFTADKPGNPQQSEILALMNGRGVGVYNYTGHGWQEGLVSGDFSTDAVALLTNAHKYPLMLTVACCTGDFTSGNNDCLGEAMQRAGNVAQNQPFGAIGGFYSSDFQSWSPPMEGQDGMNQYLMDADGTTLHPNIGGLAVYGNARMIQAYDTDGALMAGFWNPFHEPTFVPRTRTPQVLTASAAQTLYLGESSVSVACAVEGALVSAYFKGQTIGVAHVQGGAALLQFSPLQNVGDLIVTVTQFNYLPWQDTLVVKPQAGAFVVQQSYALTDPQGNQNKLADYGEEIRVSLDLKNVGLDLSGAISATLTTTDAYVTVVQGQAAFSACSTIGCFSGASAQLGAR